MTVTRPRCRRERVTGCHRLVALSHNESPADEARRNLHGGQSLSPVPCTPCSSMRASSSSVSGGKFRAAILWSSCSVELAPISAEVTSCRRSTHYNASCASDWRRASAILLSSAVRCRTFRRSHPASGTCCSVLVRARESTPGTCPSADPAPGVNTRSARLLRESVVYLARLSVRGIATVHRVVKKPAAHCVSFIGDGLE